ncbi:eEF1A lysine and N-terminal methyltransferase homolog [Prorops nasuta]|uniref:eEF1A lysine and N-terminal methyltransferase homolog n=1 Tax=Prorops nasuta TaxID=863751 RepID=UPI0034CEB993
MNLLPRNHEQFSQADYWNTFFKKRGKKSFDWYGEYSELSDILNKYIKMKDDILIVGCGNSTLSMSLYDVGYKNITNIDLSQIVIKQMQDINKVARPDLIFEQMDATQMSYPDERFNVIVDKGTLDALMPDSKENTQAVIDKYFKEIKRVLRNCGRYMCFSLLQEHILRKLLSFFPSEGFMFRITKCQDQAEARAHTPDSSIPVFTVIATKFINLNQKILELSLVDNAIERFSTTEEVVAALLAAQQSALVFNSVCKKSIAEFGEVSFDLHQPGQRFPRYTVYLLDTPRVRREKTYACFIIPQGKEMDWLFSTKEGRQQVLKSSQRDRLAIVTLRREHTFANMETVQGELENYIEKLAPPGLSTRSPVPFLSLGADLGFRNTCYEGNSELSGKFVVEEVDNDGVDYRRLIFLNNPYVIQSEARLKDAKSRRGKIKKVVDSGFLACRHHVYMSSGVCATLKLDETDEIMIIGLGGGGLCTFLHQCFPKLTITVVEIDEAMLKVAKEYFGLSSDDRMKVEIADGIQFIKDAAEREKKYRAILFDVDSKDTTVGMSCPPRQFLEMSLLKAVAKLLAESGLFILNLVGRDKNLKQKYKNDIKSSFKAMACFNLKDEVNEIVMCSMTAKDEKELEAELKVAAMEIKQEAWRRKMFNQPNDFDISLLFEDLSVES